MKSAFLKKIIACVVVSTTLITLTPISASAAWIKDYQNNWKYVDGYYNATGWRQIDGLWYYFDSNGVMQKGVIQVSGKIYLFSESGAMQTGNAIINKKMYRFSSSGAATGDEIPVPEKGFDSAGYSTIAYMPDQIIYRNDDDSSPTNPNTDASDISENTKEYTLTYKDDDGEKLKSKTVKKGVNITLYKPKKNGYSFVEWNTKKNGNGTGYDEDEKIKMTEDHTLYAIWEENKDKNKDENKPAENIYVSDVVITAENDASTITTKDGTLKMTAKVLPIDATNKDIIWSVKNETGKATITEGGVLTAVANGKVTVKATVKNNSKVTAIKEITITGQGNSGNDGSTSNPNGGSTSGSGGNTSGEGTVTDKTLNVTKVSYDETSNAIQLTFDKSLAGAVANGSVEATGAYLTKNYTISGTAGLTGNPQSVELDESKKIVKLNLADSLKGKAKRGGTVIVDVANITGANGEALKISTETYKVQASKLAELESLKYRLLGPTTENSVSVDLSNDTTNVTIDKNNIVKITAEAKKDDNVLENSTILYKVGTNNYTTLKNGEVNVNLVDKGTTVVKIKVLAQDGTTDSIHTINFTRSNSNKKNITNFKFINRVPEIATTIDEDKKSITASVENQISLDDLVADFTIPDGAKVKVGSTEQISRETKNTFESGIPKTYTVVAEDGTEKEYKVTITKKDIKKISKINIMGLVQPVAGEIAPKSILTGEGYSLEKITWKGNDKDTEVTGAFEPNTKYKATIELSTKLGYKFDTHFQPDSIGETHGKILDKDGNSGKTIESTEDGTKLKFKVEYEPTRELQLKKPTVTLSNNGVVNWDKIDNVSNYLVQLYKNNAKVGDAIKVEATNTTTDETFLKTMRTSGVGSYTVGVTAISEKANYTNSDEGMSGIQRVEKLPSVPLAKWDGQVAKFNKVTNDNNIKEYQVRLYKDGIGEGPISVNKTDTSMQVDFTKNIIENGKYKFEVTSKASEDGLFLDSEPTKSQNELTINTSGTTK